MELKLPRVAVFPDFSSPGVDIRLYTRSQLAFDCRFSLLWLAFDFNQGFHGALAAPAPDRAATAVDCLLFVKADT